MSNSCTHFIYIYIYSLLSHIILCCSAVKVDLSAATLCLYILHITPLCIGHRYVASCYYVFAFTSILKQQQAVGRVQTQVEMVTWRE